MRFCHVGSAALLPAGDESNGALPRMQAIEYGQVTFTRDAKGVGHALGDQAINQKMSGDLCCHVRRYQALFGYCAVAAGTTSFKRKCLRNDWQEIRLGRWRQLFKPVRQTHISGVIGLAYDQRAVCHGRILPLTAQLQVDDPVLGQ